ncbi:hypothetical protein BJ980_002200 [Nocardioides daedukensis]|uniref:Lipoprotein n=1 Tax=Nocardioides daedukensis TaxID=634462 RepID=A0A7Y9UQH4_9ACTN|nr:hypothetical protein [Nocardioides daedukensis]NYG59277.1 hypothetical protein [Nocardioides daedukensis]
MTLAACLVLIAGLGACAGSGDTGTVGTPAEPVTLTIEATSWNGWAESPSPAVPEVTTEEVHLGSEVTIEAMGPVTFEVTEVGDGEIRLHSSQRLAPATPSGGTNLNDLVDEFTVTEGTVTRLATPTMDAGVDLELTIE